LQNKSADVFADNIRMKNGSYVFDVSIQDKRMEKLELNVEGMHNVENAVAAIAVAHAVGIAEEKIRKAISSFKGVKRRFEYIIKNEQQVFIDDYAHHPEELRALIGGARSLFPGKKCTIIFQPHLYTRTRDLADGFAAVLDRADEIILLPIYPARERPIGGVSSELIMEKMKNENKKVMQKEKIMEWLQINKNKVELIITAGAGDIDAMVEPIKELLQKSR
jgi:UDP-N-acetylmuramate--alanine ligase